MGRARGEHRRASHRCALSMQFRTALQFQQHIGCAYMKTSDLQFGQQVASDVPSPSASSASEAAALHTLGDLLDRLGENPPRSFPMLRTTCSLLAAYLEKPADETPLDTVHEAKDGFRPFLEARKYAENSIRTYVNHVRILLNSARELGWEYTEVVPADWRGVMALAIRSEEH